MRNQRTAGLTLIEILIVIAVIGILAAVLIPNLLGARQRAYDAQAQACASAIAKGQELRIVVGERYENVGSIQVATNNLEGTVGVCTADMRFRNGSFVGRTSWTTEVSHVDGTRWFVVSQNGIVAGALR